MKKGLIFLFILAIACLAQAQEINLLAPEEDSQPIAESEEIQITQPENLADYDITIKKRKFRPLIWQDKVKEQNYVYALGMAKIGERPSGISALECTPLLPDKPYAYCAAQIDGKEKLQAYFGKQFFLNLSNEKHPYSDGQCVYIIAKVPAVPIPTEDLPQYLKFANGHFTAIFFTGKIRKHKYLYGLGQASVKSSSEGALNRAINKAIANSEANLKKLLGLKTGDDLVFTIEDQAYLGDNVQTAWALGRVELE